jgi:hypothetical protein
MSEDEKRAIKGAVLLELEEAKDALALLRAKAEQWYQAHQKVTHLLARMKRDSAQLESAARDARMEIASNSRTISIVMNLDSVLALDSELEAAVGRLQKAEDAKRQLFLGS